MKIHEPAMTFANQEAAETWTVGLANNDDPYGRGIYTYASEWATRMERAIESGQPLGACAKPCSREADDEGITGFMYGAAVSVLSHTWIHGEALRRWHNKDTQIGDEGDRANETGGTLNPALLRLG